MITFINLNSNPSQKTKLRSINSLKVDAAKRNFIFETCSNHQVDDAFIFVDHEAIAIFRIKDVSGTRFMTIGHQSIYKLLRNPSSLSIIDQYAITNHCDLIQIEMNPCQFDHSSIKLPPEYFISNLLFKKSINPSVPLHRFLSGNRSYNLNHLVEIEYIVRWMFPGSTVALKDNVLNIKEEYEELDSLIENKKAFIQSNQNDFILCFISPPTAIVGMFWVDPSHRSSGIGTNLLKKAEAKCRQMGVRDLYYFVSLCNVPVIRLLTGQGFELDQVIINKSLQ